MRPRPTKATRTGRSYGSNVANRDPLDVKSDDRISPKATVAPVVRPEMVYVTQVAPYRDGPAGVHGVLSQSVLAMAQLAESEGLGLRDVTDVRRLQVEELAAARVVALFTIGETPWSEAQRAALLEGVRAGRTCVV